MVFVNGKSRAAPATPQRNTLAAFGLGKLHTPYSSQGEMK
jgi:hypothetical protein